MRTRRKFIGEHLNEGGLNVSKRHEEEDCREVSHEVCQEALPGEDGDSADGVTGPSRPSTDM